MLCIFCAQLAGLNLNVDFSFHSRNEIEGWDGDTPHSVILLCALDLLFEGHSDFHFLNAL